MKAFCDKLRRLLGAGVLLWGLVKKLALGLIKKLTAFFCAIRDIFSQALPFRNGDLS